MRRLGQDAVTPWPSRLRFLPKSGGNGTPVTGACGPVGTVRKGPSCVDFPGVKVKARRILGSIFCCDLSCHVFESNQPSIEIEEAAGVLVHFFLRPPPRTPRSPTCFRQ